MTTITHPANWFRPSFRLVELARFAVRRTLASTPPDDFEETEALKSLLRFSESDLDNFLIDQIQSLVAAIALNAQANRQQQYLVASDRQCSEKFASDVAQLLPFDSASTDVAKQICVDLFDTVTAYGPVDVGRGELKIEDDNLFLAIDHDVPRTSAPERPLSPTLRRSLNLSKT